MSRFWVCQKRSNLLPSTFYFLRRLFFLILYPLSLIPFFALPVFAWQAGGVPVCTNPASQTAPQITRLTDGFAIVWTDTRNGNPDIFAQKLDGNGVALWQVNGSAVCDNDSTQQNPIIIDGSNGSALFFWEDNRDQQPPWPYFEIWGQRFKPSGQEGWVHNGLLVSAANARGSSAIPNGSGGAFLVCVGYGSPDGSALFGLHLDSLGTDLWSGPIGQGTPGLTLPAKVRSDGAGGAVIGWYEDFYGPSLLAMRQTFSGHPLWDSLGVRLDSISAPWYSFSYAFVPEATHGTIGVWNDSIPNGTRDIHAQRVSGDGVLRWQAHGVPVRSGPGIKRNPQAVADGQGGAIIVWEDGADGSRDIYAQRVDSSGSRLWDTLGVPVIHASGDQMGIQVVSDDAGGVIVAWQDTRNGNNDIYAQRLGPNGQRLWDTLGVGICVWPGDQTVPVISQDGSGGAVIAWQDTRNGNGDIYAQRVSADGSGVWSGTSSLPLSAFSLWVVPNPFTSFTSVPGHSSDRFSLYDISGRMVGTYKGDRIGDELSPGIYFLRPIAGNAAPCRVVKLK